MYLGLSFWQLANSIMHGIYITVFGKISADQTTIVFDKSLNMGIQIFNCWMLCGYFVYYFL